GIRRGVAHETAKLAVDQRLQVDLGHARNLAAQALVGEALVETDARSPLAQRSGDGLQVIAQARDDARPGDHHATWAHCQAHASTSRWNRPTRRSLAV